jgi:hypothetical protein
LYDDGVSVIWRLHGVPSTLTRLVEGAMASSEVPGYARVPPGMRPGNRGTSRMTPRAQSRRRESEPFVLLSDDAETSYRTIETTYQPLEGGEWAGSSDFAPAVPEGATTLTLTWEDQSITLIL